MRISRVIIPIIIFAIIAVALGMFGQWYTDSNECICQIGTGGECGIVGFCDAKQSTFCWAPLCQVGERENDASP